MTAERSDASVVTEDGEVTGPPTLAIDATGLMLWPPGKGLAGIPRVESFLINAALADPDPCVDVVAFRPGEGRFRPLAPYEQEHVATGEISPRRVKRWPGRRMALSQAFEAVRQEPGDKREADRHLARTVTNGRKGIAYQATRLLIRAYRLYRRARVRPGPSQDAPRRPAETERSLVLISHHILTQEDRSAVSGAAGKLAPKGDGGAHGAAEVDVEDGRKTLRRVLGGPQIDAGAVDQHVEPLEALGERLDRLRAAYIEPGKGDTGSRLRRFDLGIGGAGRVDGRTRITKSRSEAEANP